MNYENLREGSYYNHPSLGEIRLLDKPNLCFEKRTTKKTFLLPTEQVNSLK